MNFYISSSLTSQGAQGLFAGKAILKDAILLTDMERHSDRRTVHFEQDYQRSFLATMIQHSNAPNTYCRIQNNGEKITRLALRDIAPHEEITADPRELADLVKKLGYNLKNG